MNLQAGHTVTNSELTRHVMLCSILRKSILFRRNNKILIIWGTIASDSRFVVIDEKTGVVHSWKPKIFIELRGIVIVATV